MKNFKKFVFFFYCDITDDVNLYAHDNQHCPEPVG